MQAAERKVNATGLMSSFSLTHFLCSTFDSIPPAPCFSRTYGLKNRASAQRLSCTRVYRRTLAYIIITKLQGALEREGTAPRRAAVGLLGRASTATGDRYSSEPHCGAGRRKSGRRMSLRDCQFLHAGHCAYPTTVRVSKHHPHASLGNGRDHGGTRGGTNERIAGRVCGRSGSCAQLRRTYREHLGPGEKLEGGHRSVLGLDL